MLTRKERQAQEREERIQECLKTTLIDTDESGQTYAIVLSQSKMNAFYTVEIDESRRTPVSSSCDCTGNFEFRKYCIHMEAIDRFFSRIYQSVEMHEITETVASIEDAAVQAVKEAEELEQSYEQLAEEKCHPGTADIRKHIADEKPYIDAVMASDYITAGMHNGAAALRAQQDEITHERQIEQQRKRDNAPLNGNRGFGGVLLNNK